MEEKRFYDLDECRQGVVYKYTSPDGKVYIGQTINEKARKRIHKFLGKEANCVFNIAIREIGFENFEYTILYKSEYTIDVDRLKKKLKELEQHYIQEYKSYDPEFGYNATLGGELDNVRTRSVSEETLTRMSKGKDKYKKEIGKYDLNDNLIETYESIEAASKSITNSSGTLKTIAKKISGVVNNQRITAYGFKWKLIT